MKYKIGELVLTVDEYDDGWCQVDGGETSLYQFTTGHRIDHTLGKWWEFNADALDLTDTNMVMYSFGSLHIYIEHVQMGLWRASTGKSESHSAYICYGENEYLAVGQLLIRMSEIIAEEK